MRLRWPIRNFTRRFRTRQSPRVQPTGKMPVGSPLTGSRPVACHQQHGSADGIEREADPPLPHEETNRISFMLACLEPFGISKRGRRICGPCSRSSRERPKQLTSHHGQIRNLGSELLGNLGALNHSRRTGMQECPRFCPKRTTKGGGDPFLRCILAPIGQKAATVPVLKHGRLPYPGATAARPARMDARYTR